ncbi:unnamed protein product [Toxocara canis]|uniref:DUF19 domain-containing protein n=1 Tax=Toxocara canis TaxID=6265 RepID=A0A3P7G151_TOXCA|nr:unnamed protein product [Toxocara canis]
MSSIVANLLSIDDKIVDKILIVNCFMLQLPLYSRESVLMLCGAYVNSRDNCLASNVLEKCTKNEMVAFVQSHMSYYCGNKAQLALRPFDCIKRALSLEQRCLRFIKGIPLPTHQAGKCNGIPKFFDCVRLNVESKCGTDSLQVLVDAIAAFGCELNTGLLDAFAK